MTTTIAPALDAIRVTIGEVDNVLRAGMHDLGSAVLAHVKANWPVGPDRGSHKGGTSLAGWSLVVSGPTSFSIVNGVDYTEWVHAIPKYGGPPGLAFRLLEEAELGLREDVVAYLSDEVLALIVPRV